MAHTVMICGLDYADGVQSQREQDFANNVPLLCEGLIVVYAGRFGQTDDIFTQKKRGKH